MNEQLAPLLAKRFIQRRDVKAVQLVFNDKVIYTPDRELKNIGVHSPLGFRMGHLTSHLASQFTYGHYLLDSDSNCRMFAFDLDLKKSTKEGDPNPWNGWYLAPEQMESGTDEWTPNAFSPRDAWLDRSHPSRMWTKMQMGALARKLVSGIQQELDIPCAAAYSGSKGIHVYGFTGEMPAVHVREAALVVIESSGEWELERGNSQFRHANQDPVMGYPNWSLEVFPKQDTLDNKDLGNLLRLPLGRNAKSDDPTFFLDLTTPVGVMQPHPNPVRLLEYGDPYEEI